MKDTILSINLKTIMYVFAFIFLIVFFVAILNQMDNRNKHTQFIELNNFILNSKKISEINQLINDSLVSNKQQIDKVCGIMNSFKNDLRKLDVCELFLKRNNRYYQISYRLNYENNVYKNIQELEFLPSTDIEKVVALLDSRNDSALEEVYAITQKDKYIWTVIKLKNAYFFARLYKRG